MTVLEVFADVGCPFAYVGLRRLLARRDELGRDDVVLRVHAWPLELVNGVPLDPAFIAEEVDVLRDTVAPDLFAGFDPAAFPASSLPAMDLVQSAYEVDVATGEQVSLALRSRCSRRAVTSPTRPCWPRIAAAHGVTVDAGARTGRRARRLGSGQGARCAGLAGVLRRRSGLVLSRARHLDGSTASSRSGSTRPRCRRSSRPASPTEGAIG